MHLKICMSLSICMENIIIKSTNEHLPFQITWTICWSQTHCISTIIKRYNVTIHWDELRIMQIPCLVVNPEWLQIPIKNQTKINAINSHTIRQPFLKQKIRPWQTVICIKFTIIKGGMVSIEMSNHLEIK